MLRPVTFLCVMALAGNASATWRVAGPGGRCAIEGDDEPGCLLTAVSSSGAQLWRSRGCVARDRYLVFTDATCDHLLVVDPVPKPAARREDTRVAALYKKGDPLREYRLREFGALPREVGGRLDWLEGAGLEGRKPSGVTVRAIGGAAVRLPWFGGRPERVVPSAAFAARLPACGPGSACSWTDDDGVLHVVDSIERVPPAYRGRLKLLDGSTVSLVPGPAKPEPSQLAAERDEARARSRALEAALVRSLRAEKEALAKAERAGVPDESESDGSHSAPVPAIWRVPGSDATAPEPPARASGAAPEADPEPPRKPRAPQHEQAPAGAPASIAGRRHSK